MNKLEQQRSTIEREPYKEMADMSIKVFVVYSNSRKSTLISVIQC